MSTASFLKDKMLLSILLKQLHYIHYIFNQKVDKYPKPILLECKLSRVYKKGLALPKSQTLNFIIYCPVRQEYNLPVS
jgi:hypothetical protein